MATSSSDLAALPDICQLVEGVGALTNRSVKVDTAEWHLLGLELDCFACGGWVSFPTLLCGRLGVPLVLPSLSREPLKGPRRHPSLLRSALRFNRGRARPSERKPNHLLLVASNCNLDSATSQTKCRSTRSINVHNIKTPIHFRN
jgi:hypothetical protein